MSACYWRFFCPTFETQAFTEVSNAKIVLLSLTKLNARECWRKWSGWIALKNENWVVRPLFHGVGSKWDWTPVWLLKAATYFPSCLHKHTHRLIIWPGQARPAHSLSSILFIGLSTCLPACVPACLSACLPVYLSVIQSFSQSASQSVNQSVSLSVHRS